MDILEFQAKKFCREYGIPVPKSVLLPNIKSIQIANHKLGFPLIFKAQVKSKNRARSGGICLVRTLEEANEVLPTMFDQKINDQNVGLILAEEMIQFTSSYSITFAYDKQDLSIILVAAQSITSLAENGNQIQQIENKIHYQVDPLFGLLDSTIIEVASALEIEHENWKYFQTIIKRIWRLFDEHDIEHITIDPLVFSEDKKYFALGVDIAFDDCAIFRHADVREFYEFGSAERIQNLLRRLDCDYSSYKGNICVLTRTKEMCAAISDILISLDQNVSALISIDGEISIEKMKLILAIIQEKTRTDTIIIHSVGEQSDNNAIVDGINSYLKTKNKLNIILRTDGVDRRGKEMEKDFQNYFFIESLEDIPVSLEQIFKDRE